MRVGRGLQHPFPGLGLADGALLLVAMACTWAGVLACVPRPTDKCTRTIPYSKILAFGVYLSVMSQTLLPGQGQMCPTYHLKAQSHFVWGVSRCFILSLPCGLGPVSCEDEVSIPEVSVGHLQVTDGVSWVHAGTDGVWIFPSR